jgi:hypothetical protein
MNLALVNRRLLQKCETGLVGCYRFLACEYPLRTGHKVGPIEQVKKSGAELNR